MEILELFDALEEMVVNAKGIVMTDRCIVHRYEMIELIKEMKERLPREFKEAAWIKEERQRILLEAQKDANSILKEAENRFQEMVDEHEITRKAHEQERELIETANRRAKEIRLGTKEYVDGLLRELEAFLGDNLRVVQENRKSLK